MCVHIAHTRKKNSVKQVESKKKKKTYRWWINPLHTLLTLASKDQWTFHPHTKNDKLLNINMNE